MVHLTCALHFTKRKFIDSVRIYTRGGNGGNGLPKYGGVGGKGGDVYAEAVDGFTLRNLKDKFPRQRFMGGKGEDSKSYRILGNPGEDIIIQCPPGVTAVTDKHRVLGDLNKKGDRVLLAKGGVGGGPYNDYLGQRGQAHSLTLDLKLLADVGFVGFPNAGKSTLLKALSRAKPKIASYPFTTIEPNVGILQYEDLRTISAADLPGLIEGAHYNYGMGHKFLKHCLRTKLLLFVVDIDGFQLSPQSEPRTAFETIILLNKELELYDEELIAKPALLAINKIDNDEDGSKFQELKLKLENMGESLHSVSEELRPSNVINFQSTIAISAAQKQNIPVLKEKIRHLIDINDDMQRTRSEKHEAIRMDSDAMYV